MAKRPTTNTRLSGDWGSVVGHVVHAKSTADQCDAGTKLQNISMHIISILLAQLMLA